MSNNFTRLNQYRSMWVLVFFDLPTETRTEKKVAARFRKELLNDGFAMFQYSIYMRFCASRENASVHIRRTKNNLPKKGKICIMQITDKQFGMMELFHGQKEVAPETPSQQLELF
ncbi:CRISPR-associated endonuclease Cas2 [Dokdonia sp. Dokd-P16]|uniref:CRISPR-associated endonuclease Cas2 n=1 Tax=Dokdonia sp. Dokd-P16 TaxID=2173169 RepID=UPI000D544A1F|nr:CRISPR-associated endonuclease Cas2 [Dokdonia sp. Dokd-P16]AWH74136.1 CRISPR-associated endonuclease Cas2 [Dokdonia sp. Dokd-P16]